MFAASRLSLRSSGLSPRSIEFAESMGSLGLNVRVGEQFSCFPDVEYPWDLSVVKALREFDPAIVPVFVRTGWYTPNGRIEVVGRHAIARYVPVPSEDHSDEYINALMPGRWGAFYGGLRFKQPLLMATTLEKLDAVHTQAEAASNKMLRKTIGDYVPLDGAVVETFRAIWHQNHTKKPKEIKAEVVDIQVGSRERGIQKTSEELRYRLKSDWKRLERIRQAETDYDRNKAQAEPGRTLFTDMGRRDS